MEKATKVICAILLLGSALFSQAQSTIGYEAGNGERNVFFNGTPVADGNYAEIGFFTPGFNIAANAANLVALNGAWNQFDFTAFRQLFGPANDGRFSASTNTANVAFDAKKIALWLFKTTDNAAPQSGFGNVQGYGIFSGSSSEWTFPTQGAVPPGNMTMVTSDLVDVAYHGSFDSGTGTGFHLYLNPVPEPSTFGLLGLITISLALARFRMRGR